MARVCVKESEIWELLNDVADKGDTGHTDKPEKTYEQGVQEGILWVLGESDIHPLD